jgi:hypothetical protein
VGLMNQAPTSKGENADLINQTPPEDEQNSCKKRGFDKSNPCNINKY